MSDPTDGDVLFHVDRTGTVAHAQGQITPVQGFFSRHGVRYAQEAAHTGSVHWNGLAANVVSTDYAIESFWELFRQQNHPKLLSRFHSLFAFEDMATAKTFLEETGGQRIWRVSADEPENIHRGDMTWLRAGNFSEMMTYTHNYWTGAASENPRWELLLPLPVTVR